MQEVPTTTSFLHHTQKQKYRLNKLYQIAFLKNQIGTCIYKNISQFQGKQWDVKIKHIAMQTNSFLFLFQTSVNASSVMHVHSLYAKFLTSQVW